MKNPWGQREQPGLRIVVAALAVLIVGFLVYRQIDRWRGQAITVWVAASDLPAGTEINQGHLKAIQARTRDLAPDVIPNPATVGRVRLGRPKSAGQPIVDSDLERVAADPGAGLLGTVPEGRVLMTYLIPGLPITSLGTRLRLGDRFDIMAGRGREEPLHLGHDTIFLGYIAPQPTAESDDDGGVGKTLADTFVSAAEQSLEAPPSAGSAPVPLILGVRPEDVRRLVWAQSSGLTLFVIFHGAKEVRAGELLPFPAEPRPRADQLELILGAERTRVALENPL